MCASDSTRTWAREFRYDGARQRYLTRELDPSSLGAVSDQWTDYVGNSPIADYEVSGPNVDGVKKRCRVDF